MKKANHTKRLSVFSAYIILFLGLSGFAMGIFLVVSNFDQKFILNNLQNVLVDAFFIISIMLAFTGVFGIYSTIKDKKCYVNIYWITLIFWLLLFGIVGVLAFQIPDRVKNQGCNSIKFNEMTKIKNIISKSNEIFCKSGCPCYSKVPILPPSAKSDEIYNYSLIDKKKSIKTQDCQNWISQPQDMVIQKLQKIFQCSGWCQGTQGQFFRFTDINRGKPRQACFEAFLKWFQRYGQYIYIASFIISTVICPLLLIVYCHIQHMTQQLDQDAVPEDK